MNKEDKILSKFLDIGATEIKVPGFRILIGTEQDKHTLNYKHVICIDRRLKTYQKYHFIEKGDVWQYHFSAMVSSPITEAEHRIITELFDYWRKEECKKKKKKAK